MSPFRTWAVRCLVAGLLLGPAAPARAVDVPVTGHVQGGSFTLSAASALAVPLLRADRFGQRSAAVRLPVTVHDARGTGAGWSLSLAASATTAAGQRAPGLRAAIWSIAVRCAGCTRPRARTALPLAIGPRAPVRVIAAAPGSGMGRMRVTAQVVVSAPLTSAPGPYTLRPVISRVTGP